MKYLEFLSVRVKLFLILLIPFCGIVGLGMLGIYEKLNLVSTMDQMHSLSGLAIRISNLVHEIQKERGMTAGFLGGQGHSFQNELTLQRAQVDAEFKRLQDFATRNVMQTMGVELGQFYQTALSTYEKMGAIRRQVDHLEIKADDAIHYYTGLNGEFLSTIHYLSTLSATVEMASLTRNYNTFLQGKERAGLERAVIASTLAGHRFGPGMYRKFSGLVAEQESLFGVFRSMAWPDDRQLFDTIMADPVTQEVQRMRDALFATGYASSLYVLLGQLYQNMALRGAYHSIKNLLIRGSLYGFQDDGFNPKQQQVHYKEQFERNYHAIQTIVEQILALSPAELSPEQRQDVGVVWSNIQAYRKSVDVIIELQQQGKHLHAIDQDVGSGVKIDDRPAEEAIGRLMRSTRVGHFGIATNDWFKAVTTKINRFKELEDHLAANLVARSAMLRAQAWQDLLGYLLFGMVIMAFAFGFGWLLVRQVRAKTEIILRHNEKMVAGDLAARIPMPTGSTRDELDRIAKSINDMVEGLEKSTHLNQQTMTALQVSESRVRAMLETAPDAIISLNAEGSIAAINPAGENLFGYYPGTLVGKPIGMLVPNFHVAGGKSDNAWYARLSQGDQLSHVTFEMDGICQDAGAFPVEISLSSYLAEDNSRRFTMILKDITERKQVKAALTRAYEELEQRVQERTRELEQTNRKLFAEIDERIRAEQGLLLAAKVFETATEGILITDANVKIIRMNHAFTSITGYSHDELINHNPRFLKSGRHDATFYEQMWLSIQQTGSWSGEIWNRRKNGEIFPQRLSITSVWNAQNELTNYVGILSDISRLKETEKRLEQMAYFDALTQLPNRLLFRDRLQHELDKKTRHDFRVAVLFIDLDRFKHVNDSLGHSAGDQLLVEVAGRIQCCLRKYDTVARLGGDEFAAIITGLKDGREAAPVARKIIDKLKSVFFLSGHEVFIGGSIGISIFPSDGEDFETLTKHADMAMYKAKESGRGLFKFYEEAINTGVQNHLAMESRLRSGLKNNEFSLFYQPKVRLDTGEISGMEALVRWFPQQGPMVSPAQFIPIAEETGIILTLGTWILREACQQTRLWRQAGHPIKMAVNLSALQFQKHDLVGVVKAILEETGLSAEALELEITESMVMGNMEISIERMKNLKDLGVTLAVDDFGTGYSSLNYLKQFPIDTLKIDQSFIRDLSDAPGDKAIVLAIISLGKALNLNIVAEGVETREQVMMLKHEECHEIQGYFFSKPLPADKIQEIFDEGRHLDKLLYFARP
ncbi:MAG: EAL domain-containing protein [Magnetococcus sp. YQC-5]